MGNALGWVVKRWFVNILKCPGNKRKIRQIGLPQTKNLLPNNGEKILRIQKEPIKHGKQIMLYSDEGLVFKMFKKLMTKTKKPKTPPKDKK